MGLYIDEGGELRDDSEEETIYAGGSRDYDENRSNTDGGNQDNSAADADAAAGLIPEKELKEITGGKSYADWLKSAMTPEARAAMEKIIASYGKPIWSQLKGMLTDPKQLATLGAGLLAASKPNNAAPTGYQGKIPKLTATSNMLTAPPVGRRPGSGGINYGGGTTYRNEKGEVVSSNEKTLEELLKAAQENPFNRPSTYENPSYGRPPVSPSPGGGGLPDMPPTPTTTPTPGGGGLPDIAPPSAGGYTRPPPKKDTSGFVTGAGDTGDRFDPFKPSLEAGTTMAKDPSTRVGNTVTTDGITRGYDPLRGTMFTNAEMQARADKELADRQRRRAEMEAGTYVQPEFSTSSQNTAPPSEGVPGFVAPIYNAAILPPKDQPYVNPYASSLASPATIPLMSGESQEQGAARLQAQSDALEQRRAAKAAMRANMGDVAVGMATGGLAPKGFVVPADVVSHLGNGSSEAGLKLLIANLGAEAIKGEGDGMSDSIPTTIGGKQEARVANDEAFISPEMVRKIGGGSAEKGAKKLYAMMDRVREERTGTTKQGKQIDPNKFMPGGSVQKYQTGGTTTRTVPAGATGSESSLSNWAGDYVTNMLGQGAAQANKPYEAYTGPLTAGASGLQNQAFNTAFNLRTPGSIGQAAGTAGGIANLAANMQYTPQTTNFLGQPNVSGLGMSPSYGMNQQAPNAQQQPFGLHMTQYGPPRGDFRPNTQQQQNDLASTGEYTGGFDEPVRKPKGDMFQTRPMREYGGSVYNPATGATSRDMVPLLGSDPRSRTPAQFLNPESPEPFAIDGEMTGGVMRPPQQMDQDRDAFAQKRQQLSQDTLSKIPAHQQLQALQGEIQGGRPSPEQEQQLKMLSMQIQDDPSFKQMQQQQQQMEQQFEQQYPGDMSPSGQSAGLPGLMQGRQQPQASQPVGDIAQQYMNPYLESALRPQMAEMQRVADIARVQDAGRLTQAGAYGGSRQAIMESEGRRNLLGKQSEALGQGYATAYDKAMAQFNADQNRRSQEAQFGATFGLDSMRTGIQGAQAQAQAGALQSTADQAGLRGLLDAGAVERGIESEGIAADKAQFEEARLNPYKMVQFQQSLLSGMPLSAQSYSMPGTSNLQQFSEGASTIDRLLKILSGQQQAVTKP